MAKRKMTKRQLKKRSKIAEKLKGKKGINPFAVATAVAKGTVRRKRKR